MSEKLEDKIMLLIEQTSRNVKQEEEKMFLEVLENHGISMCDIYEGQYHLTTDEVLSQTTCGDEARALYSVYDSEGKVIFHILPIQSRINKSMYECIYKVVDE